MRIACVYWWCHSVGGIGTHLNSIRKAAIDYGDKFDILHSMPWKNKKPKVFDKRKWVLGGDTRIWIDGEIPQNEYAAKWLEKNYDAVVFGYLCPNKTKKYKEPDFLHIYNIKLPKVAWVMDGYFDRYPEWSKSLPSKLLAVFCPLEQYAKPLKNAGVKTVISAFPFHPLKGKRPKRSDKPLLVWPNQWKEIKGVTKFLEIVPDLPEDTAVELYSTGIRYFQLRHTDTWRNAVDKDIYHLGGDKYNGKGRAIYVGNVDVPDMHKSLCRAWYTCNLQGMKSKINTYSSGSYNNTEVEALYYGALPILHNSGLKTALPPSTCLWVSSPGDIPQVVRDANRDKYALDPERQKLGKEFVMDTHLASHRYLDVRRVLES